ncbi:hypothetical protein PybrP1_005680 [[Pythium] brassicae (nom. inval.)]|nr:hypothetical protein PybrP1_005680 [[Pythium] brassicae (nom. inval.)]
MPAIDELLANFQLVMWMCSFDGCISPTTRGTRPSWPRSAEDRRGPSVPHDGTKSGDNRAPRQHG